MKINELYTISIKLAITVCTYELAEIHGPSHGLIRLAVREMCRPST